MVTSQYWNTAVAGTLTEEALTRAIENLEQTLSLCTCHVVWKRTGPLRLQGVGVLERCPTCPTYGELS